MFHMPAARAATSCIAHIVGFLILTALVIECRAAAQKAAPNVPPEGFIALFNGKDLTGWFGHGTKDPRTLWRMEPEALAAHRAATREDLRKHWHVENGELVNDGQGLYASTDRDFTDFELRLEYRTVARADSGIYLRGCPQVQIWDTTLAGGKWKLGADRGSGGLWNNAPGTPGRDPRKKMDRPFGQWNQVRIVMIGPRVSVWLNQENVVDDAVMENYFDRTIPVFPHGPIQLQTHGGEIRWRNIFLREIQTEEANRVLRERDSTGFTPLFNGHDFTGWKNTTGYAVEDGLLVCTKKGGTLFTQETYGDYVLDFEFQLPPGGNNGLAIHYPGRGNPAYEGVELQILDNAAPKYATLKPWQYHGSAYGIQAARRGFQRPAGTWNHQRVTCQGSRVRVELNGYEILDVDLARTKAADGGKHPGAARTSGHIGFFGHGDRVAFRNVRLKRLPVQEARERKETPSK